MSHVFRAAALAAVLSLASGSGIAVHDTDQAAGLDAATLARQLDATTALWNRGDLDGFITPYDAAATFMTAAGPIGKDAMKSRYLTRYFTAGAPDQQLRFEQISVRPLGADHALMIGRFVLTGGGRADQSGWFTLVWTRTADGWRIIHDHSS